MQAKAYRLLVLISRPSYRMHNQQVIGKAMFPLAAVTSKCSSFRHMRAGRSVYQEMAEQTSRSCDRWLQLQLKVRKELVNQHLVQPRHA
jgi:hypothetical protein